MKDNNSIATNRNVALGLYGFGITCKKFIIYILSLIFLYYSIGAIGNIYTFQTSGYEIGNRRRLISVLRLELLMIYFSIPIYLHLFSYFHNLSPNEKEQHLYRRRKELLQKRCYLLFMLVMFGAHITYFFYFLPFNVPYPIYWICALGLGLWMHLFFFSIAFMGGNTFISILILSSTGRSFVALLCRISPFKKLISDRKSQVLFTLFATAFLSIIQWYSSDKVVVKQLELSLPHFPKTSKPLNIAMLSDLHAGAMVYQTEIAKVVDKVNEIEENFGVELDAVLIVGDLIDAPRELIEDRMEPLQHLRSRLGTFAVTGNHEYYYGNYEKWQQLYRDYGINVMENDVFKIDDRVCLVGLQDLSAYKSGIKNTAMNVSVISKCPSTQSIVIMAHNPAATKKIMAFSNETHREIDLILSGCMIIPHMLLMS
jgi:predicted MPP superfamily phosphohydrolase